MANNVHFSPVLPLICFFLLAPSPLPCNAQTLKTCGLNSIYQLGDSVSDTGNLIQEHPESAFAKLPYGETFFKNATGRCSNGLLMIDYFAISAGIPFVDAFLNSNASLYSQGHGVNFAVAGSTALPSYILADKKISSPVTNSSLSTQLDWMFTYFNGICYDYDDCAQKLKSSLFIVGEIGENDYRYALLQGKTIEEVKTLVPEVVQAIKDAVTRVIDFGAVRVVVPGNFPVGCFPIYLTQFRTNDSAAYDQFHCLKGLNNLSFHHNELLQQAIQELKNEHPNVAIIYVCENPDKRISWDGVHLTQKANKYMAMWLIHDIFPKLRC
ncbi:hypothetical protein CUMW_179580 [Citrus unshiu]|uniref:SGNH hydrolase-type esterase domain-containing protein n=1 Tax=Citrus unshiu TaxID=55188 RepID=A0A2H5PYM6_CITUN|nr:hypothetical protein CUMW_179580 [Citrus unshiu]